MFNLFLPQVDVIKKPTEQLVSLTLQKKEEEIFYILVTYKSAK